MNIGVISSRYATALLDYVRETGGAEKVRAQVESLLRGDVVEAEDLAPELQRFVSLVASNSRADCLKLMFTLFLKKYDESRNTRTARLRTAVPVPGLEDRISKLLSERFGGGFELESGVDPSLIGGYVVELDDYTLDASVKHQLDTLRRELVDNDKRIV